MSSTSKNAAFKGAPEKQTFAAMLFDMGELKIVGCEELPADLILDGTIVDSTGAIVKHWHKSVSLSQ